MSPVFNIYVQILPFRENFRAFVMSIPASKTKQSAGVRFSEETFTCKMERCVSTAQTKQRRLQTFLPLQSLCKSSIQFALKFQIRTFPRKKQKSMKRKFKKTLNQKMTETF